MCMGILPDDVNFLMASSLYHPDTVERSLRHDGSGDEPGLKDPDGNWDLRPHRARIIDVTDATLRIWHAIMEDDSVPMRQTRMVYTVNRAVAECWRPCSPTPRRLLGLEFSRGWDESIDRKKGYFESVGCSESWDDVILQGPHLYVSTPMYKSPNPTMKNKQDWSATISRALPADAIPATAYKPAGDRTVTTLTTPMGVWICADVLSDRLARMAANNGERTLIPALIPPAQPTEWHLLRRTSSGSLESLALTMRDSSARLIADFAVRAAPKADIYLATINRLPVSARSSAASSACHPPLRLNCVTTAYADLWRDVYRDEFTD